jgi:endonuclease/exonuclease/phosphatase family metal-dependent hydrolase
MEWASSYALWNRLRNAVLFRAPWRLERTDLHRFTKSSGQYQRGFVAAHLGDGRHRIVAVSVHLGLSAAERPRHSAELVAALDAERSAVVVGGDFNEPPDGEAMDTLLAAFRSGRAIAGGGHPTFPADEPRAAIDDVLVAGAVGIASFRAGHSDGARRASDHRPVIADLELLPPPGALR